MRSNQIKIVELPAIKESTSDYEAIEKKIKEVFRKLVYYPILKDLNQPQRALQNSIAGSSVDLLEAIRTGRVTFNKGSFSGKFNSSISADLKEVGAKWDRKTSAWKINSSSLPLEIRNAISASEYKFQQTISDINRKLGKILPENISEQIKVERYFDSALWKVDQAFHRTIQNITAAPQLSDKSRKRIAKEWQDNMSLWIQDFSRKEISELRKNLQTSVFAGNRYESTISTIRKSYNVTENKAKFLARQETGLLMSKFKETRYVEAGVPDYKWGCVAGSKNHPVRPWHKILENKVFRWDNPPITTQPGKPVRRNNPGQDYNCRCFARPVVMFKGKKK